MKIVGKIFASMYCTFFALIVFVFMVLSFATSILEPDYISSTITNSNFMEMKVADIEFEGKEDIIQHFGEDVTVEEAIIKAFSEEMGVRENLITEALEDEEIIEFIGEVAGIFVDYTMTNDLPVISYDDYKNVFEKQVVQEILKDLDYSTQDIKDLIDLYNNERENWMNINNNVGGGQINANAVAGRPY